LICFGKKERQANLLSNVDEAFKREQNNRTTDIRVEKKDEVMKELKVIFANVSFCLSFGSSRQATYLNWKN